MVIMLSLKVNERSVQGGSETIAYPYWVEGKVRTITQREIQDAQEAFAKEFNVRCGSYVLMNVMYFED